MNVYSLATPTAPVLIRSLSQDYPFINKVHDMFVRNDTVFASCQYQGLFVFRLTAAQTFTQLGSISNYTFAGYNHSSALTPDGKTLVFMDEVPNGLPVKIADVSNLGNINIVATINQYSLTTPHNPFMVSNQYCFVSSYEDGLQLFDISQPGLPFLAGYFDTYPQGGGNVSDWSNAYSGQWGAYPFFPSRNIFALDGTNGIFMLRTHLYMVPVDTTSVSSTGGYAEPKIYPNPARQSVYIDLTESGVTEKTTYRLLSADGRILDRSEFSGETDLDISGLTPGIYTLQVMIKDNVFCAKKLVISE
jgi:hypothetical protein